MTPTERAIVILNEVFFMPPLSDEEMEEYERIKVVLTEAISQAVEAEREACARIAERPVILDALAGIVGHAPYGPEIATAIRSRSQEAPTGEQGEEGR